MSDTKKLEKDIQELKKKVVTLEASVAVLQKQSKAYEAKIKVLADTTLDSKGLEKFIKAHEKTAQKHTDDVMKKDKKRMEDLMIKQTLKAQQEMEAEARKLHKRGQRESEEIARKTVTQFFRTTVEVRLAALEAAVKAR